MSDMDDPAARALASMCRAEGEFSLLLDEQFEILWHTSSLTAVLGYESIVGRNGMEFIHPDDLQLVVDLIARFAATDTDNESTAPAFRPDPSDVRVLAESGEWIPHNSIVFDHTNDPAIRGLLVNCRVVVDRSDIALSIELLGTGAPVEEVLSVIARLADRGLGGDSRCTVAWWHGDEIRVVWSPEPPVPHPLMAAAACNAVRLGIRDATIIIDLSDPVLMGAGTPARDLGFSAAYLTPIVAPDGVEVIGCLLAWGHHAIELTVYPRPLHVGLRIAALAIMDGRTKSDLRWAASHDPLTLLVNRAEFTRRLDAMDDSVTLLYIDLDDFKPVNDVYGHAVGDAVLVEVATRIRDTIGPESLAGRLGGDEFAVAIPGSGDIAVGLDLAHRLVDVLRRPIDVSDLTVGIGASVGVASGIQPLIPSVLIHRADEALLEAKHAGRNMVKSAALD